MVEKITIHRYHTAQNMLERGFSLTGLFPYKDKIYNSVLVRENMGQ